MMRDEDGALTGYVYLDLEHRGLRRLRASRRALLDEQLKLPAGYRCNGRASTSSSCARSERLKIIVPVVFFAIFLLLYMLFRSVPETLVLIFPCSMRMTGGLLLQYAMGFNFSVAVWVGYIALFGIAVETGVVMVIYLDEALD